MSRSGLSLVLSLAALVSFDCGDGTPTVVPSPTPPPVGLTPPPLAVTVGPHTGATEITFLSAEPPPGSTIAGCGANAAGCEGRVRMRFRLLSASGGPVLNAIGYLHATNLVACYRGSTESFDLRPGAPAEIEILFDRADARCGIPATIATMKVVLNAPVQTDALQEWGIGYELRP